MGLIRDNEDNTEEEALTFFFDGTKKLNEFVNDKDKSNPVSSDSVTLSLSKCLDMDDVTNKNSGSNKEILKPVQDEKSDVNSTVSNVNAGSSGVENFAANSDLDSSSDSSTAL